MDGHDEIIKRLDAMEAKSRRPGRFIVQYLLFPLILAAVAYYFNWRLQTAQQAVTQEIQEAKQSFQMLQLEVRRIEAAQKFVEELFSGSVEQAMLSEKLMSRLINDEALAREISRIVEQYYKAEISSSLNTGDVNRAREIQAAAASIESPAGKAILEDKYFVIVKSTRDRQEAIDAADSLRGAGYPDAEVILSVTGYYGVALGRYHFDVANQTKSEAQQRGLAPDDAYLMSGTRVKDYVYPENG